MTLFKLTPSVIKQLSPLEYCQHMILKAVAPFGAIIFAILAAYDALIINDTPIALVSAFLSFSFLSAFFYYSITKNRMPGILFMLVTGIVLMLMFVYNNQNQGFGLAWALLTPTLSIMAVGLHWGLRLSAVIYLILFIMLFNGLNEWQNGPWDVTGLVRFSLAYFGSTFMIYVLLSSNNQSYRDLETQHIHKIAEHKKVEKLSQIDSLTGVYNRYYLNNTIAQLSIEEMQAQKTNFIFFLLQIDWFKLYVDYYGYQEGDELLVTVSELIANQMKSVNGAVFRVGGSQFAGLSIDQDITKTLSKINEIEILLNELAIPHALSIQKQVHLSIGITINNQFDNFDFESIFNSADKALFQAFENQNHKAIVIDQRA